MFSTAHLLMYKSRSLTCNLMEFSTSSDASLPELSGLELTTVFFFLLKQCCIHTIRFHAF